MCFNIGVLFYCILTVSCSPAPTHLLVTRVGPCNDDKQYAITMSELSITTQTYDSSLSGTLNISQNISNGWKVKVTIEKCLDIRNIDSCDHFKTFYVVSHGCKEEDDNEQDIYNLLFYYTKPQLECPVRAGAYKLVDYPFFTEDNYLAVHESKISTSVFGYIYRLDGYTTTKQKVLCIEAILQLRYIRHHDWTQNVNVHTTIPKVDDDNEGKEVRILNDIRNTKKLRIVYKSAGNYYYCINK